MSLRVRALVLATMVVAMNLVAMTVVAQAQPPDGAAQFRGRQRASQVQPATDDAIQRELAERWNTDYYQAIHMSPAQHKAWLQAHKRFLSASQTPIQVTAPVPPTKPNVQPTWLVVSLGGWRRHWRSSLDWPCWPPGVRTAGLGSDTRPSCRHGHAARWGCRAHPAAPSP